MNSWVKRNIEESTIIGGNERTLYAIGPNVTINGNIPYKNLEGSPWASSNVLAKVSGVTKGSNAVFPDSRGGMNFCAKMSTIMEEVKALGFINMDVLVSGSIYLGKAIEPIKGTSNPYSKMEMGVKYNKKPDFLSFDYKVTVPAGKIIQASGFGSKKEFDGQDYAEVFILLQKRWEDSKGNIHALRVGTGRERFGKTVSNWVNNHHLEIHYGDITKEPFYRNYMKLIPKAKSYYARNSKGKMVPVIEEGWGTADDMPTHVILMASSGCGTAFIGKPGMTLWVDNFAFGFNK